MKNKGQMTVANRPTTQDPSWDRVIEMVKGLSIDQRLNLADNLRSSAIADVKAQQGKLQSELSQLSSLLGEQAIIPQGNPPSPEEDGGTRGKILQALRSGPKTVRDLQAATRTQWLATGLSQLVQTQKIVTDGKRPATYSLNRR